MFAKIITVNQSREVAVNQPVLVSLTPDFVAGIVGSARPVTS